MALDERPRGKPVQKENIESFSPSIAYDDSDEDEERLSVQEASYHIHAQPPMVPLPYAKTGKNEYMFRITTPSFRRKYFELPNHGIFLDVQPYTVSTSFSYDNLMECRVVPDAVLPSPAGANETIVSDLLELKLAISKVSKVGKVPVIVTLPHSGADKSLGYETIIKAFDEGQKLWHEVEEYVSRGPGYPYKKTNSIQVLVDLPTTLAVVTRVIVDRFQVTPKGCVVRSSVCHDVTVEFPEGAVDKTMEGTMKLILMPESIHHTKDACPILCVDGFSNSTFSKPVIVKMPIPNNAAEYSTNEIRLLRLEDNKWEENKWEDVTDQANIVKFKTHIEFYSTQFSCLWPWMSKTKIKFASKIFRYLRSSPRAVCFAAFKDNEEASLSVQKLTLVCVANHKQYETVSNMRGEGCSKLAVETGDQKMRPNDKAYLRISGADMRNESFSLRFLEDEVCRKELSVRDTGQDQESHEELVLNFFPNTEEITTLLLATLRISKDVVFLGRGRDRQRIPMTSASQPEVEEEAQVLEGAVANPLLLSPEDQEEEEDGVTTLTVCDLTDEQRRWLVVGICLNKTLLPPLRVFLKQEIEKHYNDLKVKHSIDKQIHGSHLKKDGKYGLSYKSINNNAAKKKKSHLYDYNVKSAEDLGKLYLMPYMAKFTGFDDTCDLSAVLGILSSASVFSADVQKLAKKVKNDVRNPWGHCNFKEWTDTMFTKCCQLMKSLFQALKLPEEDEKPITDEIGKWETKGVGTDSFANFIEFAKAELQRLSTELKSLEANQKEQAEQIAAALQEDLGASQEDEETTVASHKNLDETQKDEDEQKAAFLSMKEEVEKIAANLQSILETLVKDNVHRDKKIADIFKRQKALEEKQESHEKRMETVEQKVKDIASSTDEEPVECFGILITDGNFKDLPEDIIHSSPITTYIDDDDDIPGKEDGKWKPEKFLRQFPTKSIDIPRNEHLQNLLEILQEKFQEAMPHVIELLSVGKEIVNAPLKENQDLAEKTIEIVSSNLNCSWETLADHLKVHEDIVKRCKEEYSGDIHEEVTLTSQMLRQWIKTSDKSCTLEVVFDALRLCGDKKTGEKLATYTTEWIKKHCTSIAGKHW